MIDVATTSRAKCRICKAPIEKGTLRFGVLDFTFSSSGSYRWHHLACAADRMRRDVDAWLRDHSSELPVPLEQVRTAMDPTAQAEETPGADLPDNQLPASLQAVLAKKAPSLPRWLDADTLPRLHTAEGLAMSRPAQAAFLGACKSPPSRAADGKVVDDVVASFGQAAATDLFAVVFERWASGGTMRDDWVLRLLARCDERIVEPVGKAAGVWMRMGGNNNQKAQALLDALVDGQGDRALLEVQQLAAAAWGEVFSDYELVAAFEQLARPVRTAAAPPSELSVGPIPGNALHNVLSTRRWEKHYDYLVRSFGKSFGDRKVSATLHFEPGMDPRGGDVPQTITRVSFHGPVDPVVLSEVLATIDALEAGR